MRILYLGELIPESMISWCLRESKEFERVDHLTKPTLQLAHVSMNPLPDKIVLKCDFENNELGWSKRYPLEIPKIFVYCKFCFHKFGDYTKLGYTFDIDKAIEVKKDIFLNSLVQLIRGVEQWPIRPDSGLE